MIGCTLCDVLRRRDSLGDFNRSYRGRLNLDLDLLFCLIDFEAFIFSYLSFFFGSKWASPSFVVSFLLPMR